MEGRQLVLHPEVQLLLRELRSRRNSAHFVRLFDLLVVRVEVALGYSDANAGGCDLLVELRDIPGCDIAFQNPGLVRVAGRTPQGLHCCRRM